MENISQFPQTTVDFPSKVISDAVVEEFKYRFDRNLHISPRFDHRVDAGWEHCRNSHNTIYPACDSLNGEGKNSSFSVA